MAGAAAIRAGGAYVEIFAKDGAFQQAMGRVQAKMRAVSQTLQRFGTGLSLGGAALGAPLVLAARQAATFQDALLGMQAAAGLTGGQVAQLRDEALKLSQSMGAAPATIAQAFLELAKAGMSVEDVLNGAGKSAVEFARISGVDAERAAVFMKAAMNVFGVSAQEAVDTLSAAADSSETSIAAMIESFSQVGSAGQAFNQSLFGISQAMAVLAKSNIVGEEAGTAIKTMLTKLVAPTDDAKEALGRLGLKVTDFRDEMGRLLPMAQIAGVFERALANMGGNAEGLMMAQDALVDVFEQRGIKVITAFANLGEKGFAEIARQMKEALPVSEKFKLMMSGISGQFERLQSAVNRVSIAFGEAIQGRLVQVTDGLVRLMDEAARLIQQFPGIAIGAAAVAAGMVALGTAAIVAALAIKGLAVVFATLTSPIGIAIGLVAAFAYKMTNGFQDLEVWGMRIAAAWKKVGIWMAAAFRRESLDDTLRKIKEVDDELARWEVQNEKKREADRKRQMPPNAGRQDEFRKPMEGGLPAAAKERKGFVSAGTFGDATMLGIGPELNELQQIAADGKRAADGIEQLVQKWNNNPREPKGQVIDTTKGEANETPPMVEDPAKLPWWAPKEAFDALGGQQGPEMSLEDAMAEMQRASREATAGGTGEVVGAAAPATTPEPSATQTLPLSLDDVMRQVEQYKAQKSGGTGEAAAVPSAQLPSPVSAIEPAAMQSMQLSLESALQQIQSVARDAAVNRAAEAATAGSQSVGSAQQTMPAISNGLASVAEACKATTAATLSNGKLLERMLQKLETVRGAYA